MNSEWQFCYAFSAIDGSHVPIKCPPGGAESMKQYHNFKNFYSIILLAKLMRNTFLVMQHIFIIFLHEVLLYSLLPNCRLGGYIYS